MASSEPGAQPVHRLLLRLAGIEYGARGVNLYRFAAPDGQALPVFEPGAHIDVDIAPGMTRQYSLLWPQPQPHSYCIAVQEAGNGRGGSTAWHRQSVVGEVYAVSAPRNHFALAPPTQVGGTQQKTYLFAGGIGITPIISMYRQLKAQGRPVELFYWTRSAEDCLFRDELAAIDDGSVHLLHTRAGQPVPMLDAVLSEIDDEAPLYCCGPTAMIETFDRLSSARDPDLVHRERFSASPMAAPASRENFQVRLARAGQTLDIGPDQTILGACLAAGVDVPYSCEEGVCGACEVRVLEGQVEHRDQVLSEASRAKSTVMMVCCSRGKTDLVLDI